MDQQDTASPEEREWRIEGTGASPGIAIGRTFRYRDRTNAPAGSDDPAKRLTFDQVPPELARLQAAISQVRANIITAQATVSASVDQDEAEVFDAHLLMLDDPALTGEVERRIRHEHQPALTALRETAAQLVDQFKQLDDEYLRGRAADVEDVASQLADALSGNDAGPVELPKDAIVIADQLLPSDIALFDPGEVAGIVTGQGSRTSHIAILARALQLPTIVGAGPELQRVEGGTSAIVDGDQGSLILSPGPGTLSHYQQRLSAERLAEAERVSVRDAPAVTLDGIPIRLFANIGGPEQAAPALAMGAEGIGLFRTEFLFIDRPESAGLPGEEEQRGAYQQALEVFAPRPVVIRTLDAGGDKPVPGIELPAEANPFLGVRGLRLTLRYPELLRTQLRALLRAATAGDLWIMLPMVTTVQDVRDARAIVDDVRAELTQASVPHRDDVPLGIMVETPAAALTATSLAREVDFFSLGTNDLTQYVLAVDRTQDELSQRYSALEPAVLRLIGETVAAADAAGKPVAICGEMAGDPAAIPFLLGLGVRELSMTASSIDRAKEVIAALRVSEAEEMVRRRLSG